MVKLRNFSISDLKRVMEIEKVSFPDPWFKSYFKKFYEEHPNGFVVAKASKQVVGYIVGYTRADSSGFIKTIAVDPNYRGRGIGTKLINFIINKLKRKGAKKVSLHTRINNKTAHLFYKKLGFKIVKEMKKYYRDGSDAYEIEKKI